MNILTTLAGRSIRLISRTVLIGLITATFLLLSRSEVDSSSVAVYDIVIAKGSFDLDLPNDTVSFLEDAVIFYHNRQAYTVRYRIGTEALSHRIRHNNEKDVARLVDRSADDVIALAGALRAFAERYRLPVPLFIGSFVQSGIAYRRDEFFEQTYPRAYRDYHKYGIETLYDRYGDCEDKVILAAALLKAAGYEVGYIELPRHVLLAIGGRYGKMPVTFGRDTFSIWEMTRPGHQPGDIAWDDLEYPTVIRFGSSITAKR